MRKSLLVLAILLPVVLGACGALPGDSGDPPIVSVASPANGATVPVNEPLSVQVMASDPDGPGVVRVQLEVNGTVMDSFDPVGAQEQVSVALSFTPTTEGALALSVTAIDEDQNSGTPAILSLNVVAASADPPPAPEAQEEVDEEEGTTATVIGEDVSVRFGPDVNCSILGTYDYGQQVEILAQSADQNWWKIDFNQEDAWLEVIYASAPTGPQVPTEAGPTCAPESSGDGSGSGGEPSGPSPPVNDGSDGSLCGDGVCQSGESADWCGDCTAGPTCGDGTCEGGENFASCPDDCMIQAAICGDDYCDPEIETIVSCPADCAIQAAICGDDYCDPEIETILSCPADCAIKAAICGDGFCDPEIETSQSCPADC